MSFLILTACSLSKAGKVEQKGYYRELQFEAKGDLPILTVRVNGIEANFLFDTGASSNVVSIDLANKLSLETISTGYVYDSGGDRAILEYVSIDTISIDSINFLNTTAVIADLNSSEVASCFALDGIIGTNLMRKAYWKLDYPKNIISLSDDISNLTDNSNWDTLNFEFNEVGNPTVKLELNEQLSHDLIFDTGFNGTISVPKNSFHQLNMADPSTETTYKTGISSFGLYGKHKSDTTYFAKIKKAELGNSTLELNDQIVAFNAHSNLIGSKFLSNHTVVLDWENHFIYLKKSRKSSNNSLKSFGFNVLLENNKLKVGALFANSNAQKNLEVGDEILTLNGVNCQDLSAEDLCNLYLSGPLNFEALNQLELKVKRGNTTENIKLNKEVVIP